MLLYFLAGANQKCDFQERGADNHIFHLGSSLTLGPMYLNLGVFLVVRMA